jgi:hypothetical protein
MSHPETSGDLGGNLRVGTPGYGKRHHLEPRTFRSGYAREQNPRIDSAGELQNCVGVLIKERRYVLSQQLRRFHMGLVGLTLRSDGGCGRKKLRTTLLRGEDSTGRELGNFGEWRAQTNLPSKKALYGKSAPI